MSKLENPWERNDTEDTKFKTGSLKEEEKAMEELKQDFQQILIKHYNKNLKIKQKSYFTNFNIILVFIFIFLGIFLYNSIYYIENDQEAVVISFVENIKILNPGLHFILPKPFTQFQRLSTQKIFKEQFFSKNKENQHLILTKDQNLIEIQAEINWKINDSINFISNLKNPKLAIKVIIENTIQEFIAQKNINYLLNTEKNILENEINGLLIENLNNYNSGVKIEKVKILNMNYPKVLTDTINKIKIKEEEQKQKITEFENNKQNILLEANLLANKIVIEAQQYKDLIINNSEIEVQKFSPLYEEYKQNSSLIKQKLYLDLIERIIKNLNNNI